MLRSIANPTPAQCEEKIQQLNMVATIRGCVTLTVIALTGKSANAGLAGVLILRPAQIRETIKGYSFFMQPAKTKSLSDCSRVGSRGRATTDAHHTETSSLSLTSC